MQRGGGRGFRNNSNRQKQRKSESSHQPEELDNEVMKAFRVYSKELDDKHDRHERIVKMSRDITIESKRIIFLLHTIDGRKNNKEKILGEAKQRLQVLIDNNFKAVAKELDDLDPYQYKSAYSAGLQEFIEAYTFMEYMEGEEATLSDWKALQTAMHYKDVKEQKKVSCEEKENTVDEVTAAVVAEENSTKEAVDITTPSPKQFIFFVNPTEYVLGLSDLTGELMRRCINSLGSGETQTCIDTCKALQHFYTGYISLNVYRCRELSRKIYTMRQSMLKTENVCYNVKVRGREAAKWGSVNAYDSKPGDDVDEGFF